MRFDVAGIALAFCLITVPALADDTIKIGYIDPLSGGGASIGAIGLKTYQYLATASPTPIRCGCGRRS